MFSLFRCIYILVTFLVLIWRENERERKRCNFLFSFRRIKNFEITAFVFLLFNSSFLPVKRAAGNNIKLAILRCELIHFYLFVLFFPYSHQLLLKKLFFLQTSGEPKLGKTGLGELFGSPKSVSPNFGSPDFIFNFLHYFYLIL